MPNSPTRILLVEDNPGDARLIRELLREAGSFRFELLHVERLAQGLERLADTPVDVVLLDLSLPDAHGIETVTRTLPAAPEAPIVVLTGLDDETVAVQAVQSGAQDYLVKGQVESGLLVRSIRYAVERKRLERERHALLRREQEARSTAEAAVRARDEVLRVVSHDLGNSLTAVGIHASLLERAGAASGGSEEVVRRARGIRRMVEQMHRLRQDLLDVASIEAGRLSMSPERQNAADVALEAAEALEEITAERSLTLEVEVGEDLPDIRADRQRLRQVLANLLGNAIKFTAPGGRIELRAQRGGPGVRFAVVDQGPGIPAPDLPHIFDRFWKGRSTDRTGAGLGLAISKGIVEAHGGEIWAESEEGRGAAFYFTIPASSGSG